MADYKNDGKWPTEKHPILLSCIANWEPSIKFRIVSMYYCKASLEKNLVVSDAVHLNVAPGP